MLQKIKEMILTDKTSEMKTLCDIYKKLMKNECCDINHELGNTIHEKLVTAANICMPLKNYQLSAQAAGWADHGSMGFVNQWSGEQSNEQSWRQLCSENFIAIKQVDVVSILEVHPKLGHLLDRLYEKTIIHENGNYLWARATNEDPLDDPVILAIIWSTFEKNKKKEIEVLAGYLLPRETVDQLR